MARSLRKKGLDPNVMPDVSMLPEQYRKPQLALFKLHVVAEVLNDGWAPDFTDMSQWKYEPWFTVEADDNNKSGVSLAYNDYDNWNSNTNVSVHVCKINPQYRPCLKAKNKIINKCFSSIRGPALLAKAYNEKSKQHIRTDLQH